jgi:hypothetical protein
VGTVWDEELFQRFANPLIRFANLPGIAHVDDVHRIFAEAIVSTQTGKLVMQVLDPGEEHAFEQDRKRVRGWLEVLSRPKLSVRAREQVQREVESLMDRTVEWPLRGKARFADGVLAYSISPVVTGVEGVIAFGMALLADDAEQRWKRVGRCELKGCTDYFLRKPGDWRQEYCRPSHSMKARDAARGKRIRPRKESSR